MFSYVIPTGALYQNGEFLGICYSGHGAGLNNPAYQNIRNVGPLPKGVYRIGRSEDWTAKGKGPVVMRITPINGTNTFKRDGFLFHGDNKFMNHTASDGCIVASYPIRLRIASAQLGPHPDDILESLETDPFSVFPTSPGLSGPGLS